MLLSRQIEELASDFQGEAAQRPYLRMLIPELATNRNFWQMVLEILAIILHRRGFVIVRRSIVEGAMEVPPSEKKEAGV